MIPITLPTDIGQEDKTIILMVTCWKFRQVWNPFFTLFYRYWPDCPYKLIMVTDVGTFSNTPVIQMGIDRGWVSNFLNALKQVSADRIIIFQEDFLLKATVDTNAVRKLVKYSRDNEVGCLRICPCPGPTGKWKDEFLGVIAPNDPYRVSLQMAIWNPKVFKVLMREGESAWDFEITGSKRSPLCPEPFLSLWRESENSPGGPIPYFISAVRCGVWETAALELLKQENIPMDGITRVL